MTIDTKKLAEFAAGFLSWEKEDGRWMIPPFCFKVGLYLGDDPHAKYLFDNPETAPILAHLAEREMEKRGFSFSQFTDPENRLQDRYNCEFFPKGSTYLLRGDGVYNENEYIALWSAIQGAVGEK